MTEILPHIPLPFGFSRLLQMDTHANQVSTEKIRGVISSDAGLRSLVAHVFDKSLLTLDISLIIKATGLDHFLHQLASCYLGHLERGTFDLSQEESAQLIADCLDFNRKVCYFEVNGHHRAFLFSFYIKAIELSMPNCGIKLLDSTGQVDQDILAYLDRSTGKVDKIDWAFALYLQSKLLGEDPFKILSSPSGFKSYFLGLSEEKKKYFMEGLMNYSASIHDEDFLFAKEI